MVQISQYTQTKDLVDGAHEIFGFHPGYRGLHADGRIYRGSFTALPEAKRYTRARHLQGETVPATVRFSKGGGNPDAPFGATVGMATRFYLPDGDFTNLVMLSQLLFPARRPDDLLEAIALAKPEVPGGALNKQALLPFLQRHPEVANVLHMRAAALAPVSFAHSEFHAVHVFRYVAVDGVVTNVRCHWTPQAGVQGRPVEELATLSREVLLDEFDERLRGGPVRFHLELEIGQDGDPLDDPTALWPAERERVVIGALEIVAPVSVEEIGDPVMNHDPTKVTDGIELNDDPILAARRGVYESSVAYRTQGWRACPLAGHYE